MSEGKYADYVEAVLKECPDADTGEIEEAFAKYENEFYIPPQDAMRSVLRRFKSGTTPAPQGGSNRTSRETKKVASLSELSGDDRDIEIEVAIITHNIRDQMIRGEEKQIAFGMLEDNPWEENGERVRWDYKDWGPHANLTAGSIVRIEGGSVNEVQREDVPEHQPVHPNRGAERRRRYGYANQRPHRCGRYSC